MMKAVQIGYNEFFEGRLAPIAEAGFDAVAIDFDINGTRGMDFDRAEADICRLLDKYGLACAQTHLPFYDLRVSAENKDEEVEARIVRCIRATRGIGASRAVLHPRTSITSGYDRRVSLAENQRSISRYLDAAVAADVTIAVENMPIFRSLPKAMPFYTSDYYDLCELVDSFASPNVGICWDFGHANLMDFDHAAALRFVGGRLAATHIHNNFGNDDNHFLPELGTLDFHTVMPTLAEIGYRGPLTLEPRLYNKEPEILASFMRHAFVGISWLCDML